MHAETRVKALPARPARTAIVHYWLMGMRGGEKVLEALCRLLPNPDVFTLFYDPDRVSPFLRERVVQASFLNPLRMIYRGLLPLMPLALENFDLRGYDLVISSESGPAKGVLVPSKARHLCYCHTPMRYLWELYPYYRSELGGSALRRAAMAPLAHYMRLWDFASAARVDHFVANSENVRRRIRRAYRREAQVVYPPVAVDEFENHESEGYYLIVSELTSYKRLDYAIRAFAGSSRRLKIAGDGPQYRRLRSAAASNVEFCGRVPDGQLRDLYARCAALLMPGEEDFGITMVEALASGKPVIALGRGGALEIVQDDCGVLYEQADELSLNNAIDRFEAAAHRFDPARIQHCAKRFSPAAFNLGMRKALEDLFRGPGEKMLSDDDHAPIACA